MNGRNHRRTSKQGLLLGAVLSSFLLTGCFGGAGGSGASAGGIKTPSAPNLAGAKTPGGILKTAAGAKNVFKKPGGSGGGLDMGALTREFSKSPYWMSQSAAQRQGVLDSLRKDPSSLDTFRKSLGAADSALSRQKAARTTNLPKYTQALGSAGGQGNYSPPTADSISI